MMTELAPQSKMGSYERPSYKSNGVIGSPQFPDEPGRYHLYVGNPCPWCHRVKLAVSLKKFKASNIGMPSLLDDPGKSNTLNSDGFTSNNIIYSNIYFCILIYKTEKASRGGWVFSRDDRDPLDSYDLVSPIVAII